MTSPADPNRTREGYTRDYKMHLKVRESPSGTCNRIQLNVQRQNKLYTTTSGRPAPPQKVTLYDLDCARPIEFERGDVHTASGRERLGSSEAVVEFLATFPQMENQLFGFLFEHRTALP